MSDPVEGEREREREGGREGGGEGGRKERDRRDGGKERHALHRQGSCGVFCFVLVWVSLACRILVPQPGTEPWALGSESMES